jgi:hypothetical protein
VGSWLSFATSSWAGPVFILVTLVGLVLSAIAWRKKGARSGIRGAAWSLLPMAAWLTSALGLIGRMVSAIVQFAGSFAFSPKTWLGVILVGVSALLFLVSGGIPLTGWRKHRKDKKDGRPGEQSSASAPAKSLERSRGKAAAPADDDDDLSDVRDILKKHGIS